MTQLRSTVIMDDITKEISRAFDFQFDGTTTFDVPPMPDVPANFSIGLIVGPSGSGKSTLLKSFGQEENITWDSRKAVASHFGSPEEAISRLGAVGLNSIPSQLRPYHVLSTGEKFRAALARKLKNGAVIDEFTSVVDRNVARAASVSIRRWADLEGLERVVLASCHYDIIEWLQPDWTFDTNTGQLSGRRAVRRPPIEIKITPCSSEEWPRFGRHHYLTNTINKGAYCWLATWNGVEVGFASALAFPNQHFKKAWRGHRTVVLPDFQGMGIGVRISDAVGQMFLDVGSRYFSKTAHPRMGEHRQKSPLWRATSKNGKDRQDYAIIKPRRMKGGEMHVNRVCYSHEYIGDMDK